MKGKTRQTKYAKAINSMGRKVMGGAYDRMEGAAKKIREAMPDPTSPTEANKTRKALKKNVGGPLPAGRMLAQNAKDIAGEGLDVGSGFGGGGKAFAGLMGKAMKKTARQLSGIEKNPRNIPVDNQGNPQSGGMASAARMKKKGGVMKKAMGGRALLGSVSPLYGAATGQGAFGEIGQFGLAGQLGKAYRKRRGRDEEEVMQNPRNVPVQPGMSAAPQMMKEGGKVKK
jgi:hypothetical protein